MLCQAANSGIRSVNTRSLLVHFQLPAVMLGSVLIRWIEAEKLFPSQIHVFFPLENRFFFKKKVPSPALSLVG